MESKKNKQQKKFHIKKGDTVKVIAGDSRGKSGKVLSIVTADSRAFVEGINIVSKHVKPSAAKPNGGIEKKEMPVHVSNLMLVDSEVAEVKTKKAKKAVSK
jgi:large subunit ribosomal protein L24